MRRRLARLEQEEGDHVDDGADPRVDEEGVAVSQFGQNRAKDERRESAAESAGA